MLRSELQWNLNWNTYIFIQENAFESFVWKMAAILFRPQCVHNHGIDLVVLEYSALNSRRINSLWPNDVINLGQHRLRWWLDTWWHKVNIWMSWTNINLSVRPSDRELVTKFNLKIIKKSFSIFAQSHCRNSPMYTDIQILTWLTHWPLGDMAVILKLIIFKIIKQNIQK